MSDESLKAAMDFRLTPPAILDADPVTTAWPMPEVKPWEPIPPQSLWARFVAVAVAMWGAGTV